MATLVYPSSADITAIAQDKMPRLIQDRPIFDLLPVQSVDDSLIIWEQKDNFTGLQQVRGLDGAPARVAKIGVKRYIMEPGYYGEYIDLDERELTRRRQIGTMSTPIDVSDLVMEAQDFLLQRRLDRIELIGWSILQGTFSVSGPNGAVMHTDSYSPQTFSASVAWATSATATPLADFRAVQLLHAGHSVDFGAVANAYMNRVTWNRLISNGNSADLYGRRQAGLGLINNLQDLNVLFQGDDLPKVNIYDEGYLDSSGTFQRFIPTGTVVVVGKRPAGQTVGAYKYTRNVNNPDMGPGAYMKVIDNGEREVPRRLQVHDGHNGGPVIWYPSAIVVMSV